VIEAAALAGAARGRLRWLESDGRPAPAQPLTDLNADQYQAGE
jgi:hypothetical protein